MRIDQIIDLYTTLQTQTDALQQTVEAVRLAKEGLKGLSGFKATIARSKVGDAEEQQKAASQLVTETTEQLPKEDSSVVYFAKRFAAYQIALKGLQDKVTEATNHCKQVEESSKKDAWKFTGKGRVNPKITEAQNRLLASQTEIIALNEEYKEICDFVADQRAWEIEDEAFKTMVETGNPYRETYTDDEEEPFTALPPVTCYPRPQETEEEDNSPWTPPSAEAYLQELAKSELIPEPPWEPVLYDWNWNTPLGKRSYLQRIAQRIV